MRNFDSKTVCLAAGTHYNWVIKIISSSSLQKIFLRTLENERIDLGTSQSNYCPPSFKVHLKENQNLRSVVWEEPQFEAKLLKIFKSSVSLFNEYIKIIELS